MGQGDVAHAAGCRGMLTQTEMMREIIAYAMEVKRNEGLEEAARFMDRWAAQGDGRSRWGDEQAALRIRSMKRDPAAVMTDWWAKPIEVIDMVPIGA